MSFDTSIEIWLDSIHQLNPNYDENEADDLPVETLALRASSQIFGTGISTTADLAATVAAEMDIEITSLLPGLMNLSKLCLLYAVSSNCPQRAEFVQGIIGLDPNVQGELMQIIKSGAAACMSSDAIDAGEQDDEEEFEAPQTAYAQSRKRERDEDDMTCKTCEEKDKELAHLQTSIRRAIEKEDEDSQKYHRELSMRDNKLMDVELQLMQRDERIAVLQQEVEQSLSTVRDQQTEMEKSKVLLEQIQELHDEIDVLKPKADRVEVLETTTERLKAKLDDMADLKEQLAAESASHLKTQNKYVDVVREVDSLRKTKTQLEEYRAKCTELEITGNELSLKLNKVTRELENVSGKNENLFESQQDKTEDMLRLTEELRAAEARLREVERSGGIGQGMSELNPELMFELTSLRSENEKLKNQLDMSSVESLENLEKQIDDVKSINASLQTKWMETKDLLAESRAEAASLSQSVSDWTLRYHTLEAEFAETVQLSNEDRSAMMSRHEEKILRSNQAHHNQLSMEISTREAVIASTTESLERTKSALHSTVNQLQDKCACNEVLSSELESTKLVVVSRDEQIANLGKQYDQDLTAAKENHSAIVDLLKKSEATRVEGLERKHSSAMKSVEIEVSSISSELDTERRKRRRLEKEKRHLEGEVHRHKTQAQINSSTASGSNADLDETIKELKSMQKALDQLKEENTYLRNQAMQMSAEVQSSAPSGDSVLKGGAGRILPGGTQRARRAYTSDRDATAATGNMTCGSSSAASYGDYLEQTDISDKKMNQLVREKRELMAKQLEETKEKNNLAQKLLQTERDNSQLKAKITKLTLENERYQRKAMMGAEKAKSLIARAVTEENEPNLASNYPAVRKAAL